MLYDERRNIAEDPSYRPGWMSEAHWRDLLSYWATNDIYRKRSTANKRNRASSRGARHTQGSVSGTTHARHMVKIHELCTCFYLYIFRVLLFIATKLFADKSRISNLYSFISQNHDYNQPQSKSVTL